MQFQELLEWSDERLTSLEKALSPEAIEKREKKIRGRTSHIAFYDEVQNIPNKDNKSECNVK